MIPLIRRVTVTAGAGFIPVTSPINGDAARSAYLINDTGGDVDVYSVDALAGDLNVDKYFVLHDETSQQFPPYSDRSLFPPGQTAFQVVATVTGTLIIIWS
jgi:hypothetical protein